MKKKLNVEQITSELRGGSAFFPGYKGRNSSQEENQIVQENQPNKEVDERGNARTPVRPNGKRIITRNSFEIYEDQMDSLRKLSLQEKMEGKLGSMSQMMREAIDDYLNKRKSSK